MQGAIEFFLFLLVYFLQLCIVVLFASIVPLFLIHRKHAELLSKTFFLPFLLCFTLLLGSIFYFTYHPLVYCPKELVSSFTIEQKEEAISLTREFYSARLPLFPILITIRSISDEDGSVLIETDYWFLGIRTQIIFGGSDAPSAL